MYLYIYVCVCVIATHTCTLAYIKTTYVHMQVHSCIQNEMHSVKYCRLRSVSTRMLSKSAIPQLTLA